MITMQYSGAQNILPVSKEIQVSPDIDGEPSVKGEDGEEPEVQGEEPTVKDDGEPKVQGEDETESEEQPAGTDPRKGVESGLDIVNTTQQPTGTDPRKGVESGLDIANTTQQTLPPAYNIKIIFDAITAKHVGSTPYKDCGDWDIGVYVQGKLVRLNNMNQPLKVCIGKVIQLKDAEATLEIPGDSVESVKDYQPLSIFSAGSELNKCNPKPLPADLPEVRKILADKGSSRPYYAHAKEQIDKIQDQISNGCIQKDWIVHYNCTYWHGLYYCPSGYHNETLANLNYVFGSPGYGKVVSKNTLGNPERVQIDSCHTYPRTTDHFCLFYTIECPLCAGVRVH